MRIAAMGTAAAPIASLRIEGATGSGNGTSTTSRGGGGGDGAGSDALVRSSSGRKPRLRMYSAIEISSGNAKTRLAMAARSEERRVGKECRSRWSPDHEKKNGAHELL